MPSPIPSSGSRWIRSSTRCSESERSTLASTPEPAYQIVTLLAAKTELLRIRERARTLGMADSVREVLGRATESLMRDPQSFGDPINETHRPGGLVYLAMRSPFLFRYATFEVERKVFF